MLATIAPSSEAASNSCFRLASVAFVNVQHLLDVFEYVGDVNVDLRLANVKGAVLVAGFERKLDEYYQARDPVLDYEIKASSNELRTKPNEYGLATRGTSLLDSNGSIRHDLS